MFGEESSEAAGTKGNLWAGAVDGWQDVPKPLPRSSILHCGVSLLAASDTVGGETACMTWWGTVTAWPCLDSHPASNKSKMLPRPGGTAQSRGKATGVTPSPTSCDRAHSRLPASEQ